MRILSQNEWVEHILFGNFPKWENGYLSCFEGTCAMAPNDWPKMKPWCKDKGYGLLNPCVYGGIGRAINQQAKKENPIFDRYVKKGADSNSFVLTFYYRWEFIEVFYKGLEGKELQLMYLNWLLNRAKIKVVELGKSAKEVEDGFGVDAYSLDFSTANLSSFRDDGNENEIGTVEYEERLIKSNLHWVQAVIENIKIALDTIGKIPTVEGISMEKQKNVNPIQWIGTQPQLVSLFQELQSKGLISQAVPVTSIIKAHFPEEISKNIDQVKQNVINNKKVRGKEVIDEVIRQTIKAKK